jgi:hypothetical protein
MIVLAAFTLSFGFLWNNKSSREGSDAPKPDLESKRGLSCSHGVLTKPQPPGTTERKCKTTAQ